jgi:hypothetical protein
MNRGPMMLFGAIIAVGFGPALWLGAQFGTTDVIPGRPPVTVEQQAPRGGGAGAAPDATARVLDVERDNLPRSAAATSATPAPTVRSTRGAAPTAASRTSVPPIVKPSSSSSPTATTPPTESTEPPTTPTDPAPTEPDDPLLGGGITLAAP